jgi:hypothetical protein
MLDAPVMRVRASVRNRGVLATLLVPGDRPLPRVGRLGDATFEVQGAFGHDLVRVGERRPWSACGVAGDAGCAWVRRATGREGVEHLACGGTRLEVDGVSRPVVPGRSYPSRTGASR